MSYLFLLALLLLPFVIETNVWFCHADSFNLTLDQDPVAGNENLKEHQYPYKIIRHHSRYPGHSQNKFHLHKIEDIQKEFDWRSKFYKSNQEFFVLIVTIALLLLALTCLCSTVFFRESSVRHKVGLKCSGGGRSLDAFSRVHMFQGCRGPDLNLNVDTGNIQHCSSQSMQDETEGMRVAETNPPTYKNFEPPTYVEAISKI